MWNKYEIHLHIMGNNKGSVVRKHWEDEVFSLLAKKIFKSYTEYFKINGLQATQENLENVSLKTNPEHRMSIWK